MEDDFCAPNRRLALWSLRFGDVRVDEFMVKEEEAETNEREDQVDAIADADCFLVRRAKSG